MLDLEKLYGFEAQYKADLENIDNEIKRLQGERIMVSAKVQVTQDFIAYEESLRCDTCEDIETETEPEEVSPIYQGV